MEAVGEEATALLLEGNNAKALALFREMADGYHKGGDAFLLEEIEAMYSMNSAMEKLPEKKALLKQMEKRISEVRNPEDPAILNADVALLKAEILRMERKNQQAWQVMQDALTGLDAPGTDLEKSRYAKVSLYQNMGAIASESGAYKEAIRLYKKADEVMGMVEKPMEILYKAINEMNLGVAYRALGDLSQTENYYQSSLALFDACGGTRSLYYPYLLTNLCSLYNNQGRFSDALDYGKQALEAAGKDSPWRAPMLITCAAANCNVGQFTEAEQLLQEAGQIIDRQGATILWVTMYEQAWMDLYALTGHLKASIEMGEKIQRRLKQQTPFNPRESSSLYQKMASNASQLGDKDNAFAYLMLAMDIYEKAYGKENDHYVSMLHKCGVLMEEMGLKKDGKEIQQSARAWLEDKYGKDSQYVLSLIAAQAGGTINDFRLLTDGIDADVKARRFDDALAKTDEAVGMLRKSGTGGQMILTILQMRSKILEIKQDTKALSQAAEAYNDELRQDMRINLSYMTEEERELYYASVIPPVGYAYLSLHDQSLSGPVYDAVLLRKGFLLGAGIGLDRLISDSGDATLQRNLAEMKALRSGPVKDMNLPARKRFAAKERADSLENELLRKSHDYGDFLSLASLTWEDVRNSLRPDEVAVEFIQAGSSKMPAYIAFLLRHDWKEPLAIGLTTDERHLIEEFAEADYAATIYGIPDMYRVFWQPLEKYLKPGDKVYFAMDGFLNAYAFEHFVTDRGDRAMDRYELHRVSSTREVIGRKESGPERSAALFGGFDYNLSGEEVSYYASATRDGSSGEWGYLPGSLAEVEAADRILKGRMDISLYTGEQGLESRFKALSGKAPDLIHVATHGYYHEDNDDPMDCSGLVFSGANSLREEGPADSGEDGLLKASEIALMDLRGTRLIVLSACQSGVGSISSDGVYGLQRAFKKAGVHSILMSLWKVNDQVTAEMMRLFYTGLASGKDSREAFQAAREALRKTYPDPLLWAPFVLMES